MRDQERNVNMETPDITLAGFHKVPKGQGRSWVQQEIRLLEEQGCTSC
jgi:hypothetical protein